LKELSGGYTFFEKGNDLSEITTSGVGFAMKKSHICPAEIPTEWY